MPEKKERGMEVNETVDERYDLVKRQRRSVIFTPRQNLEHGRYAASYNGGMEDKQTNGYSTRAHRYDLLLTEELRYALEY
jgi:hypothetical protein